MSISCYFFLISYSYFLFKIEVYVFWNFHEREEGKYYWEERGNLSLFIEKCAQHDLFVNLRIGPYVCAEWDYGGRDYLFIYCYLCI